jgi:ADP-heptose:LPS heptosyltransferase
VAWATICRYGGVGDNLVASSVLAGLKERYGHVEVLTQEPQHVVFQNNPHIDKLSVYKRNQIPGQGWQEWHLIRSRESDFFANLSHSMETTLAFLPAQCQFQWPAEVRRKLANKSYLEMVHDICGISYDHIAPDFFPTEEEVTVANETKSKIGARFIAWVLTGTRLDKIYPYSAMAIGRLIRELDIPVVMFGAPGKDFEIAEIIHKHVQLQNGTDHNLHLAISPSKEDEVWNIRRVLTMVQHADLVIGPDTGPMWAVAMHDNPKMVLLSHASPTNITKYWHNTTTLHAAASRVPCWPCHLLHDVQDTCTPNRESNGAACISDITVETIIKTAQAALAKSANTVVDLHRVENISGR